MKLGQKTNINDKAIALSFICLSSDLVMVYTI